MSRVKLSAEEVMVRAKRGMALNLQELAIASGYGYSTVRQWHANGMLLIDGKITLREALAWRRQYEKARRSESQSPTPTVLRHPLLAAGKSGAPA
jgi:hypothetical protein